MATSVCRSWFAYALVISAALIAGNPRSAGAQTSAADGPWSGEAVCVMSTRGTNYQEDQTHRWRLTGERPDAKSGTRFWPAVWSVQGGGSKGEDRWTIDVPETSAPIAIYEIPGPGGNNSLRIESQHGQLTARRGIRLAPRPGAGRTISEFTIWERAFPKITASSAATVTVLSDSSTQKGTPTYAWQPPSDAQSIETCKWRFARTESSLSRSDAPGPVATPAAAAPPVMVATPLVVPPLAQGSPQASPSAATATTTGAQPTISVVGGPSSIGQVATTPDTTPAANPAFERRTEGARIENPTAPGATLPDPQKFDYVWAAPGMTRTVSGQRLTDNSGTLPVVKVNGIAATVVSATSTAVTFVVPEPGLGLDGGEVPVAVQHSAGTGAAPTPLIVVTGPPRITALSTLFIPLGNITTLTVYGKNLANVGGVCLPGTPRFVPRMQPPTRHDRFEVHLQFPGPMKGPVLPGDQFPNNISCWSTLTPVTIEIR